MKDNGKIIPPELNWVRDYINEKSIQIDPDEFFDYYESVGWFRGKNKIKDWKACLRTWNRKRESSYGGWEG